MKNFTKSFNDAYFFADKTIFNLQHYPDNEAWKLGPAPKNKKDFYMLPVIKAAAYEFKLKGYYPLNGHILAKSNKLQYIILKMDSAAVVSKVTLLKGDHKTKGRRCGLFL